MKLERFTALLAASIALLTSGTPRAAEAQVKTPHEQYPFSVALLLGYGTTLEDGGANNPNAGNGFGFGFGAAGGFDVTSLLYVGGRFMFFLGGAAHTGEVVVSRKETTLGLEAGLALGFGPLTLRPGIGFGLAIEAAEREHIDADGAAVTVDDSSEDLYLAPGVTALYDLHDAVFIGVDAQVPLIITDATLIGFTLLGSVGMRF